MRSKGHRLGRTTILPQRMALMHVSLLFKRSTALIKYDFAASASGGAVSEELRQIPFPWDESYFDSP
jgi:hypothetical protein